MVGRLVSCWNGLFPGANCCKFQGSVYNPHFIGKLLPQLSARNLRKGQNLELTWWHQDDLLFPLVPSPVADPLFQVHGSMFFWFDSIDQIASKSTVTLQHIRTTSAFGKCYFASLTKSFHGCPGQVWQGHKMIDQSFWWRKITEMPYKVF